MGDVLAVFTYVLAVFTWLAFVVSVVLAVVFMLLNILISLLSFTISMSLLKSSLRWGSGGNPFVSQGIELDGNFSSLLETMVVSAEVVVVVSERGEEAGESEEVGKRGDGEAEFEGEVEAE